jgi:hypothetical protein
MRLMNYFRVSKPAEKSVETENPQVIDGVNGPPPKSTRPSSASPSSRSSALSEAQLADDIRHQVLLNHLHQQQRSLLWIQDTSGTVEGVMIRKGRSDYMYSPPQLVTSPFARAMKTLNVQVSDSNLEGLVSVGMNVNVHCPAGCYDR